jgi:hypothetical protein
VIAQYSDDFSSN